MRWMIFICLAWLPAVGVQAQATDPTLARVMPNVDALETTLKTLEANRPTTLANGTKKTSGPISKNEAYNISRAASGRVGVRLGNDLSFPVGK